MDGMPSDLICCGPVQTMKARSIASSTAATNPSLSRVDVDVQGEREDGEGGEEDEGVDEDGLAVGAEAAEVDVAVGARELAEEARREEHEEHHAHHHGAPVRHNQLAGSRQIDPNFPKRQEGDGLGAVEQSVLLVGFMEKQPSGARFASARFDAGRATGPREKSDQRSAHRPPTNGPETNQRRQTARARHVTDDPTLFPDRCRRSWLLRLERCARRTGSHGAAEHSFSRRDGNSVPETGVRCHWIVSIWIW